MGTVFDINDDNNSLVFGSLVKVYKTIMETDKDSYELTGMSSIAAESMTSRTQLKSPQTMMSLCTDNNKNANLIMLTFHQLVTSWSFHKECL